MFIAVLADEMHCMVILCLAQSFLMLWYIACLLIPLLSELEPLSQSLRSEYSVALCCVFSLLDYAETEVTTHISMTYLRSFIMDGSINATEFCIILQW